MIHDHPGRQDSGMEAFGSYSQKKIPQAFAAKL